MVRTPHRTEQGQALVEFALISIVLFMLIFVVIEGAHLFQAQITVQNAARAAGRYAVTGQYDETICDSAPPPCDVRLASIRAVAEEALTGLQLDAGAGFFDPAFYEIQIFGTDASGNLISDNPGLAGQPVIIRVLYRAEVITPLLRPIAETVLVRGQTVMNNERPVQGQTGSSGNAPAVPALPPVGPTPTPPPPLPPDLYVVDKSGPTRVLINRTFWFELQVGNQGEQDATEVFLTDNMVGGGSIAGVIPPEDCTWNTASVSCDFGTLAPGASTTVTITVNSGPDEVTITNTASIAGAFSEDPGALANNEVQVVTDVVDETSTDLRLTKTGPAGDIWAESTVAFYLTAENLGLLPATEVRVIDSLPVGMDYESAGSDPDCREEAPIDSRVQIVCSADTLAPGASTTFEINAIAPVGAGTYENDAEVRIDSPVDSVTENNFAEFPINVVRAADLWITKSGAPSTVNAGERLTYTLQISNTGPSAATDVSIDDILPSTAAFVSATVDTPAALDEPCARGGDVVTCNVDALSIGQTATATIVVVPQQGGTIINSAQVSGDEMDPNTVNNSAVASNTVTLLTDLAIEKDAVGADFASGEIMPYQLTVTNYGPSTASGVVVTDTLPANTDYYDAIPSQGYCNYNSSSHLVDCRLGRMVANQTATVAIRVIPTQPTDPGAEAIPYTNWGYVRGNEPEPPEGYTNNDSASTDVVTGPPSVLAQPGCGPAGSPVQILGYNWRSGGSKPIVVTWRSSSGGLIQQIASLTPRIGFTIPFTVPNNTANGTYLIRAFQEAQNSQDPLGDRLDEFTFKVPCDGPDLAVGTINSVASVEQGEPITFTVDISNVGSAAANDQFYASLYFDPIPAPVLTSTRHISSTFRQDVVAFTGLNAGASRTVTFTIESVNVETGTLPVFVVVDSDPAPEGAIAEMNELNNIAQAQIAVLPGTPQEPDTGTLSLTGETWVHFGPSYLYELQPFVRVSVYSGTTWLASTYSAADGSYAFDALPAGGAYDIKACFVQNGISYFELLAGREPGDPWIENLWLEPVSGPCP